MRHSSRCRSRSSKSSAPEVKRKNQTFFVLCTKQEKVALLKHKIAKARLHGLREVCRHSIALQMVVREKNTLSLKPCTFCELRAMQLQSPESCGTS